MSKRDDLVGALEDAGLPDRYSIVGGLRGKIADVLVGVLRAGKRTRKQVDDAVSRALDLAEAIAGEEPGAPD